MKPGGQDGPKEWGPVCGRVCAPCVSISESIFVMGLSACAGCGGYVYNNTYASRVPVHLCSGVSVGIHLPSRVVSKEEKREIT